MKHCSQCRRQKDAKAFERGKKEFKICNYCAARNQKRFESKLRGARLNKNHYVDPWIHLCLSCPLPDCCPASCQCPINQAVAIARAKGVTK